MSKDNNDKATRARNKTVMLTPDIANQMRSRLMTGVHRSGSTEKLDTGLINQVRGNFGVPLAPSFNEETHPVPQTQIVDTSEDQDELNEFTSQEEGDLEKNFFEAIKAVENKPAEVPQASFSASSYQRETVEEQVSEEHYEELVSNDDSSENKVNEYEDDFFSALQSEEVTEVSSLSVNLPEDNFKEEIEMEKTAVNINSDLKKGFPSAAIKQAGAGYTSQCINGDTIKWEKESPLVGFLVTFDGNPQGDFIVLRNGRLIVSSENTDRGNALVINDDSVSPMHAILRITETSILVLDQLSENGTRIQKPDGSEIELSGDKANLEHGDLLIFGERNYKLCLLF